jgi:hypothetical protein
MLLLNDELQFACRPDFWMRVHFGIRVCKITGEK